MDKTLKTILPRTILRASASLTADVVALIPAETELEILDEVDEFLNVSCWLRERGEVTGFVERAKLNLPPKFTPDLSHPVCACGVKMWKKVDYYTGGRYYSKVVIPTVFFDYIVVHARVCLNCGRYEEYIEPADMERLKNLD